MSAITDLVRRSVVFAQPRAAAYAAGNMQALVLITRPARNTFDRSTGTLTNPSDASVYQGPAHIYEEQGGPIYSLGEEQQYFTTTYVSIPLDAPLVRANDDVKIVTHPDDTLVNRHYRVTGVDNGGLLAPVRRLNVVGAAPAPNA
jgi:hypothetical protein